MLLGSVEATPRHPPILNARDESFGRTQENAAEKWAALC